MAIYIINLLVFFFWKILIDLIKLENKEKILTIIFAFQLLILSALRGYSVGADTLSYLARLPTILHTSWGNITQLKELVPFETGFLIFTKIVGIISENERFYLTIIAFIIILGISKYILKNSKIVWLSLFLFVTFGFWGMSLNVLRQFLAIVVLLPSIKHIKNGELFKFGIYIVLATLFHSSAISFLIVYPLSKIKITHYYIVFVISSGIILYLTSSKIISLIINIFGYQQHSHRIGEGSGNGMLLLLVAIAVMALLYRRQANAMDESYDIYIHIVVVAILLNILALNFNLAGRAMIYFVVHVIILIPNILYVIKNKRDKFIGTYIIILGAIYYYYVLLSTDVSQLVPYVFFYFR